MGKLSVMTSSGDKSVEWDCEKVKEGDAEAEQAVREAERIFNEERARGSTAFKVEPGKTAQRIDAFDETAEQIIVVPRIVGGSGPLA
jgi:hypothetical protein